MEKFVYFWWYENPEIHMLFLYFSNSKKISFLKDQFLELRVLTHIQQFLKFFLLIFLKFFLFIVEHHLVLSSDQIWRDIFNFKLKGIYSFNSYMMKSLKKSCTSFNKRKLGTHFKKHILNKILPLQIFKMLKLNEQKYT